MINFWTTENNEITKRQQFYTHKSIKCNKNFETYIFNNIIKLEKFIKL